MGGQRPSVFSMVRRQDQPCGRSSLRARNGGQWVRVQPSGRVPCFRRGGGTGKILISFHILFLVS